MLPAKVTQNVFFCRAAEPGIVRVLSVLELSRCWHWQHQTSLHERVSRQSISLQIQHRVARLSLHSAGAAKIWKAGLISFYLQLFFAKRAPSNRESWRMAVEPPVVATSKHFLIRRSRTTQLYMKSKSACKHQREKTYASGGLEEPCIEE